jgi:RNA polymerase sigma factor (sigma-70 family)
LIKINFETLLNFFLRYNLNVVNLGCFQRMEGFKKLDSLIFENNVGLIKKIVSSYVDRNQKIEDSEAYSDGCIALINAYRTYDSTKGAFSTWATRMIRQAIINTYRKSKKNNFELHSEIDQVEDFRSLKVSEKAMSILLQVDENDSDLDKENKKILIDHYINKISWAKIGRRMGLSKERIRQKGQEAIKRIRIKYKLILDEIENL